MLNLGTPRPGSGTCQAKAVEPAANAGGRAVKLNVTGDYNFQGNSDYF